MLVVPRSGSSLVLHWLPKTLKECFRSFSLDDDNLESKTRERAIVSGTTHRPHAPEHSREQPLHTHTLIILFRPSTILEAHIATLSYPHFLTTHICFTLTHLLHPHTPSPLTSPFSPTTNHSNALRPTNHHLLHDVYLHRHPLLLRPQQRQLRSVAVRYF